MEKSDKDLGRVWFRENDFERIGILHYNNRQDLNLIIDQSIDHHEIVMEFQIFSEQFKYEMEIYTQSIQNNQIFHNLFVKYDQSIVRFCKQVLKDYENQQEFAQVLSFLQRLAKDLRIKEKRSRVANGIMNFWVERVVNLSNVTNLSACNNSKNSHGSFYAESGKNGEWNYNFSGNGWNGGITVMGTDSSNGKKVSFETEKLSIFPEDLEPGRIYEEKLFIDRLAHVEFRFQYIPETKQLGMQELPKRTKVEWPKGESTDLNGRNVFSIGKFLKLHLLSSFVEKKTRIESMLIGEYETIRFILNAKCDLDDSSDFMKEIAEKKPISTTEITNLLSNTTFDKIILVEGRIFASIFAWKQNVKIVLTCLFAEATPFEIAKSFLLDTLQNAEIVTFE
ncbi:predicted protein [Naegleria gruberi]|uniref:Predicted protein n=1 Tax=Naegleria gruberi TaxID=5762 RepID=D2V8X9_NAEGR|nr:uncharacterized protein NAEGRDRAFT_65321 [Naegleria gruberi]EFC46880.1 predicted protein [Naegleria gruberi]|eukprot:XP_002679624.1 predicted protein [Naegleria gruberi strain NEG-M]